nr:PREDICTED: polyserase-2-like [Bos mutus]
MRLDSLGQPTVLCPRLPEPLAPPFVMNKVPSTSENLQSYFLIPPLSDQSVSFLEAGTPTMPAPLQICSTAGAPAPWTAWAAGGAEALAPPPGPAAAPSRIWLDRVRTEGEGEAQERLRRGRRFRPPPRLLPGSRPGIRVQKAGGDSEDRNMGPAGCVFLLPLLLGISGELGVKRALAGASGALVNKKPSWGSPTLPPFSLQAQMRKNPKILSSQVRRRLRVHVPGEHGKGPGAEERTPAWGGGAGAGSRGRGSSPSAVCGRPAVLSGIVSGLEANVGQWPWQVSIRQGLSHVCAASLISKQWVLTLASCFRSKDTRKYEVLVGSLQVSGYQGSKTTIIPVSRIIPYPDVQGHASSAIAVAELARPLSFSPLVLPICLPTSAVQLKNATSCWVTGWDNSGIFQYEDKQLCLFDLTAMTPPYTLKELKVHLIDLQTCKKYQKESLLRGVEPISEAMICSRFPARRGDPLMCRVKDFWVLAGVMSWGSNCIGIDEPGVFTNISFYKSWIEKSAVSHADLSATPRSDFSRFFPRQGSTPFRALQPALGSSNCAHHSPLPAPRGKGPRHFALLDSRGHLEPSASPGSHSCTSQVWSLQLLARVRTQEEAGTAEDPTRRRGRSCPLLRLLPSLPHPGSLSPESRKC